MLTPGSRTARPRELRVSACGRSPSPPALRQPELTETLPGHHSPTPCLCAPLRPESVMCVGSRRPRPGSVHVTHVTSAGLAPGSGTFSRLVHAAARVRAPPLLLAEWQSTGDRGHTALVVPYGHLGCSQCSCGYGCPCTCLKTRLKYFWGLFFPEPSKLSFSCPLWTRCPVASTLCG